MKKTALRKSVIREIFASKARFLSILGIILLGVSFYAGIKATGPNMLNSADQYFKDKQLMDGKIVSTLGLTDDDLAILEKDEQIDIVEPWYSQDVNLATINRVVRFFSMDTKKPNKLNNYRVIAGRLPEKSGEIALDGLADIYQEYQLGDTFELSGSKKSLANFNETTYKVVGFVNSPIYIENMSRGSTSVGKGVVDYFGVIPKEDFNLPVYSEIYVKYADAGKHEPVAYSAAYNKKAEQQQQRLKTLFKQRPEARLAEIKAEAAKPIAQAKKTLATGRKKLAEAEEKLANGRQELAQGQSELADAEATYQQKINEGESELATNSQELVNGQATLAAKEQELVQGKAELDKSQTQLTAGAEQLKKQGINPETSVATLQGQISNLQQFSNVLDNVAKEMVATVNNTAEDEVLPPAKIEQWSTSIGNSFVDLSAAQTGIMAAQGLPLSPETRAGLLGIASQLGEAALGVQGQLLPLEQLINALVPYQAGQQQYQAGLAQYQDGLSQISQAKNRLATGQEQLNQGYEQLAAAKVTGQEQLAEGRQKLVVAKEELVAGEQKLTEENKKLVAGEKELVAQEQALAKLKKPEYFFFDRDDNAGYSEYYENAKRISAIATVFPVFFFMIAALVSLTTMTRMVDEKRGEIGALKALGYTNWEIAQKYIVYATVASLVGCGLGLLIGFNVFPNVIINAYGALYNLPTAPVTYYFSYSIQSLIVALLCTLISALVVLRYDLFSTPASLMRPKAPKAGQRIFLERLPFVWRRLNFNQKVTARNLFRYKQRMFMTVFGIAGCMALIITGFGLRDSISDVVEIQFGKLWHYQGIVSYKENATAAETKEYEAALNQVPGLKNRLELSQQAMEVSKKGVTTQSVVLDVPKTTTAIADFVLFNDRKTGEVYSMSEDGAIINEKLAKMFDLKVGGMITLTDSENQTYEIKIDRIVENYAMHFVYITPSYYEKVFQEKPVYNSELLLFDQGLDEAGENATSELLMTYPKVVNVSYLSQTSNGMDDTIDSLTIVVWVLIISAATLAFIVLYNLTNINVSERIRELSTIKVLGFYNQEVTMYVYRENNILTMMGILVGCVIGKLLHSFVLQTAEVDMLMFSPTIHGVSYLYSALLTALFSFMVMLVMHRKLRKVDMIEALKSTE